MKTLPDARTPRDLSPLVRGLYKRAANRLGVDPSYVSRVARGEIQSAQVEDILTDELKKIVAHVTKKHDRLGRKGAKVKGAQNE